MKGVVFTEFNEMVEEKFGVVTADAILENTASGGCYTAVADYDYRELLGMVLDLSKRTEIPADTLVEAFGHHLFGRFEALYPVFFEGATDPLDFLEQIESHIHKEVRKLYPTAGLPQFDTERDGNELRMVYQSPRCLGALAKGLIQGCLDRFESVGTIAKELLNESGSKIRFTVRVHA